MKPERLLDLVQDESDWEPGKPGFFQLSEEVYRSAPGEAQSGLKEILVSPKHYRHLKAHPIQETSAMLIGTICHGVILSGWRDSDRKEGLEECRRMMGDDKEGEALFSRAILGKPAEEAYVAGPDVNLTTRDGKAAMAACELANPGKIVLRPKEAAAVEKATANICGVVDAVMENPFVSNFLALSPPQLREVSIFGEIDGVWCKGRVDALAVGSLVIAGDLKITQDAAEDAWMRKVQDFGYDFQDQFYSKLIKSLTGADFQPSWLWIVVEAPAPHGVKLWAPHEETRELGFAKVTRALAVLKRCREADDWPGYQPAPEVLKHSPWVTKKWWNSELAAS